MIWKVRLNERKVEVVSECGAKNVMLATFDSEYTSKLKNSISLHAGTSCFQSIQHLRRKYRKLHQLKSLNCFRKRVATFALMTVLLDVLKTHKKHKRL